ncbi:MAG: phosphate acetyltransferase [Spirochaetes bacterium]|nr:phosphate acetyltransferase [Spirochaetota bacterium]
MSNNLYITATEAKSGKSAISLGVMEMLIRKIDKVGFFRPIINVGAEMNKKDADIELITSHFKLDVPYEQTFGYTSKEASELISIGKEEELIEGIIRKYNKLKEQYDFILCEGTDFASSTAAFEFDINGEISKNLGSPVLLVANVYKKSIDDTIRSIELALESLDEKGCYTIATIVNRTNAEDNNSIIKILKQKELAKNQLIYAIPNEEILGKPTVGEIADFIKAEVLYGREQLNRHVYNFTVGAMQLQNFLTRIDYGSLVITPGDRSDVIVACLAAVTSNTAADISGLCLTGGLKPEEPIWKLIRGFPTILPILSVKESTFPTAMKVSQIHSKISPDDNKKISRAVSVFEQNVDIERLGEKVVTNRTTSVTPKMFEYELIKKAKSRKKHIVLPEGEEERILDAADVLLQREICDITLLGNSKTIREKIAQKGLRMDNLNIIEPEKSEVFDDYVKTYYELRKHKAITLENAHDVMCDANFYGAMMVYKGDADGMVSGSVHSTADTIRPALQIIKTKPGFSIVSSIFFMCLDKVLVYGDCAVNPNPNAQELAEIALSSAQTAKAFGIEPVVAMLSYSSGKSGKGEDVEKVREATRIAHEMIDGYYPGLKLEGPMQYDSAVDPKTARIKMPDSEVAGKATVFIFPDLNTGNNTYKAVQRSAGVVAIGPVLQGLKYPVNDLSRGCTVPDIVNTVVITAIQAAQG